MVQMVRMLRVLGIVWSLSVWFCESGVNGCGRMHRALGWLMFKDHGSPALCPLQVFPLLGTMYVVVGGLQLLLDSRFPPPSSVPASHGALTQMLTSLGSVPAAVEYCRVLLSAWQTAPLCGSLSCLDLHSPPWACDVPPVAHSCILTSWGVVPGLAQGNLNRHECSSRLLRADWRFALPFVHCVAAHSAALHSARCA